MLMLRCVGGPCDGRIAEYREGSKDYMIFASATFSVVEVEDDPALMNTAPAMYHYTLRIIAHSRKANPKAADAAERAAALCGHNVSDITIRYLAPADWTDEQAIRHQFTK